MNYEDWYPEAFKNCYRRLRFRGAACEDAADATQQACIEVWGHYQIKGPAALGREGSPAMLYVRARSRHWDLLRVRVKMPEDPLGPNLIAPGVGAEGRGELEDVIDAFSRLDQTDQMLLEAFYIEGLSYEEIVALGVPKRLIARRLRKALDSLAQLLGRDAAAVRPYTKKKPAPPPPVVA